MSSLKLEIEKEKSLASIHVEKCKLLIQNNSLADAIEYCKSQEIEAPNCSLSAKSKNADFLRNKAINLICQDEWWSRRLETKAVRKYEQHQRIQGNVTNFISDETANYFSKKGNF